MGKVKFILKTEKELHSRLVNLGKPEVIISFGVRPSGELHVGHLVTFAESLHSIKRVCEQLKIKIKVFTKIVDLDSLRDFNYCSEPIWYWGRVFKYEEPNCEQYVKKIKDIFDILAKVFELELYTFLESELYGNPRFRNALDTWIDNQIIGDFPEKIQIYRICLECKTFSASHYQKGRFLFKCLNQNCIRNHCVEEEYINNHEICFNLIDRPMVKDEFWKTDIHIIGGDHLRKQDNSFRMDLIAERSLIFFGRVPFHYSSGKIMLGYDNEKMSKSRGNVILATEFMQKHDDWLARILSNEDILRV